MQFQVVPSQNTSVALSPSLDSERVTDVPELSTVEVKRKIPQISIEEKIVYDLRELINKNPELKEKYTASDSKINQMLYVLKDIDAESRLNFATEVFLLAANLPSLSDNLQSKLPKIAEKLLPAEKADLLKTLCFLGNKKISRDVRESVLWSCRDLSELRKVVHELKRLIKLNGVDFVASSKDRNIYNYFAKAEIGYKLRNLGLPAPLNNNANSAVIKIKFEQLKSTLTDALNICKENPDLSGTRSAREFAEAINYDLKYAKNYFSTAKKTSEKREQFNLLIKKIKVQFKYGVLIEHEMPVVNKGLKVDMQDLALIESALKRIPEGKVLWTPKLFYIQKNNKTENENAIAERQESGRIVFTTKALDNSQMKRAYPGTKSLVSTLIHEMGHSLQFGPTHLTLETFSKTTGEYKFASDSRYDFDDYLDISSWTVRKVGFVFDRKDFTISFPGSDKKYKTGQPEVDESGGIITYYYDQDYSLLYGYKENKEFTFSRDARDNPYEDWAEAFTEYILKPKRLIDYAPRKFLYFEEQLGIYSNNQKIYKYYLSKQPNTKTQITNELFPDQAERSEPYFLSNKITFLSRRFEIFNEAEQSLILARAQDFKPVSTDSESLIRKMLSLFAAGGPNHRMDLFRSLVESERISDLGQSIFMQFQNYMPGILPMLQSYDSGSQIGIMTQRPNRDAGRKVIDSLEKVLGFEIRKNNIYFLNDEKRSARLSDLSDFNKQLKVLEDFSRGSYTDVTGKEKALSGKFQVKFYTGNQESLNFLYEKIKEKSLTENIELIDLSTLDQKLLWDNLMKSIENPIRALFDSKNAISFFDLDGAVLNDNSKVHIREKQSMDILASVAVNDYFRNPNIEYWTARNPELAFSVNSLGRSLYADFSDVIKSEIGPVHFMRGV